MEEDREQEGTQNKGKSLCPYSVVGEQGIYVYGDSSVMFTEAVTDSYWRSTSHMKEDPWTQAVPAETSGRRRPRRKPGNGGSGRGGRVASRW